MRYSTRELTLIGVLSATNGVIEIGLGTLLHIVKAPFTGTILLLFNLTLYFLVRKLIPRAGVIVMTGFITSLLKLMYAGGDKLMPAIAIFAEAAIVESVFMMIKPGRTACLFSGAAANAFTIVYPLLSYMIFGGAGSLSVIERLVSGIRLCLHCNASCVISLLLLIHILTGLAIGIAAWGIASLSHEYILALGRKGITAADGAKK